MSTTCFSSNAFVIKKIHRDSCPPSNPGLHVKTARDWLGRQAGGGRKLTGSELRIANSRIPGNLSTRFEKLT